VHRVDDDLRGREGSQRAVGDARLGLVDDVAEGPDLVAGLRALVAWAAAALRPPLALLAVPGAPVVA
jgi:hypothetical protein